MKKIFLFTILVFTMLSNVAQAKTITIAPMPVGGTVVSTPAGIKCGTGGSACSNNFSIGTVSMTATADLGYVIRDANNVVQTQITMGPYPITSNAAGTAIVVPVTFLPPSKLTVSYAGSTGTGTVSAPGSGFGIDCSTNPGGAPAFMGTHCDSDYQVDSTVILTAFPNSNSDVSWSGCNSNPTPDTCTVAMSAAKDVTATFTLNSANGTCGTVHTTILITAPTTNLCSSGTASTITGSGPWNWNCNGTNGGTTASCISYLQGKAAIDLPQTGQTTCYDASGNIIPCTGTGQDGEILAGTILPSPRFIVNSAAPDNGDSIIDTLTGLTWTKDANLMATRDPVFDADISQYSPSSVKDGKVTWQHALDYIKKLNTENYLGHNDWRLPNVNELKSIMIHQRTYHDDWLNSQGFSRVMSDYYWSSTSHASSTNCALVVSMNYVGTFTNNKTDNYYVWPVRDGEFGTSTVISKTGQTACYNADGTVINCIGTGQDGEWQTGTAWPTPRFIVNSTTPDNSNSISDTLTGLIWTKDANLMAIRNPTFDNDGGVNDGMVTWQHALDYIKKLNTENYLGHNDWRLPNRNELESLLNYGQSDLPLWLNTQGFLSVQASDFWWSSTSYLINTNSAFIVEMDGGYSDGNGKMGNNYVWPVRNGLLNSSLLLVNKTGTGSGFVTANVGGINWFGSNGSTSYVKNTVVTLTATANTGSTFVNWSGCDSFVVNTCTVSMNSAKNVIVNFINNPFNGLCGTAHTAIMTNAPSNDLCTTGGATGVIGSGPWNWDCIGSNGGTTANCVSYLHGKPVIQLPQTGQTTCYDTAGTEIPCIGTGQDGELLAGTVWPSPRFTVNSAAPDNGDSITDTLTGLVWTKDANLMATRDSSFDTDGAVNDGLVIWRHALDYIKKLNAENYLGHNDWRLPNINELKSMVNSQQLNIAAWLNAQGFLNFVEYRGYWSSTTYEHNIWAAWYADIYIPFINGSGKLNSQQLVWPVRGGNSGTTTLPKTGQITCYNDRGTSISCSGTGQDGELQSGAIWPASRFAVNSFAPDSGNNVTDTLTSLAWAKDANVMITRDPSFDADGTANDGMVTWQRALDYIKKLNTENYLGHDDWRLPNRNELESLINSWQSIPATWLNTQGFSNVQANNYWSSTTSTVNTNDAWCVGMGFGGVFYSSKSNNYYVWPVRGGQLHTLTLLSVNKPGSGSGVVSPDSGAISWSGNTGIAGYIKDTVVTLTATADSGSSFTGWSGCDSSTSNSCIVTMSTAKAITASFTLTPINGTCGASSGQAFSTVPVTNLCANGTASSVSGTGPWAWICYGIYGGTDSGTCSAATKQSISFGVVPNLTYGGTGTVTATGGASGNPVTFSSLTSSVCSISGSTVTPVSAGTCTIAANQAGNSNYAAATQVTQNITIAKATPVITWATPAAITYGTGLTNSQLNATSGGVAGSFVYSPPSGTILNTGIGQTLSVTFTPTNTTNYSTPAAKTVLITVNPKTWNITPTAGTNGSITPNSVQTINQGATTNFTITPNTGYNIVTPVGGTCPTGTLTGTSYTTGAITTNCSVTPTFAIKSYNISASAGSNGGIVCTPLTVNHGGSTSCTISPASGYRVATFTDNSLDSKSSIGANSYSLTNVIANHTISVTFELAPDITPPVVTITYPAAGSYQPGTVWDVDATATDVGTIATLEFSIEVITSGKTYYLNTARTAFGVTSTWLPATYEPTGGYWYIDTFATPWSSNLLYIIRARATDNAGNTSTPVSATFTKGTAPQTVLLPVAKSSALAGSLSSLPVGINCPVGSCTETYASFPEGSSVTLTATPAPGYYFINWSNCDTPSANSCTVTTTNNHAIVTANFNSKTVTALSISPPVTSIKTNTPVTFSGVLSTIPANADKLLNGKTIKITVTKPDGTTLPVYYATTIDTSGTWNFQLPDIFTESGTWLATASFEGSTDLIASTSNTSIILMNKSAGYAIVVTGKQTNNDKLDLHTNSTDTIVDTLKARGFLDNDINYLKSTTTASVTKAQIQNAITTWAKNKLSETAAPLYLIMIDHGSPNGFILGEEILTPRELATWFDILEADPAISPAINNFKRFIIIGACFSGQFIQPISKPGRIVITSAGDTEESIAGFTVRDIDQYSNMKGGETFIDYLFNFLGKGNDFKKAYDQASLVVSKLDPRRLADPLYRYGVKDLLMQHPLLDANGDGRLGYLLDASDGQIVASLNLGEGIQLNAGNSPAEIQITSPASTLDANVSTTKLWLKANLDGRVGSAWAEIRTPTSTTTGSGTGGQVQIDLTTVTLVHNPVDGTWENNWNGFTTPGRYDIFFYTIDNQTNMMSTPVQTTIYKNSTNNIAPSAFSLLAPSTGVIVSQTFVASWEESNDSDGLTYTVEISSDQNFTSILHSQQDIQQGFAVIPNTALVNPSGGYICQSSSPCWWRVRAIDSYGANTISTPASFTITPTEILPSLIRGYVSKTNGTAIPGAVITVGDKHFTTTKNGGFAVMLPPGSYTISSTISGYQTNNIAITTSAGTTSDSDIIMTQNVYQLTVTLPGTGNGTITSNPQGISCITGSSTGCSATFTANSSVTLMPLPSTGSTFDGWSLCTGTTNCAISMTSAKTTTATFTATANVKVGTKPFSTLQTAYNDTLTANDAVIKLLEGTLTGAFTSGKSITVTLDGGYNAGFGAVSSRTTIQAPVIIKSGMVKMKGITIK